MRQEGKDAMGDWYKKRQNVDQRFAKFGTQTLTDEDVKAFCKEHLAPYKYPRFVEFVPELPKTATGKIQRFRLREREEGRG